METPGDPHFLNRPRRQPWWAAAFVALVFMALGALGVKVWEAVRPDRTDAAWTEDLSIAHQHTLGLARALGERPPVSVAQVDELLVNARRVRARLKDDEARAWVMQDLVDLDWARAALFQAESGERSATGLAGAVPASGAASAVAALAALSRTEAYEQRRKAMLALWRIRQRGDPFERRLAAASAASAAR